MSVMTVKEAEESFREIARQVHESLSTPVWQRYFAAHERRVNSGKPHIYYEDGEWWIENTMNRYAGQSVRDIIDWFS